MAGLAPGDVDQTRRLRGGAAHRMNEREILLQQGVAANGLGLGAMVLRQRQRRRLQRIRPHVVGGGVDEIAGHADGLRHALEPRAVEALRQGEARLLARNRLVAREAIGRERPTQSREFQSFDFAGRRLESPGSLWQEGRKLSGRKAVSPRASILSKEHADDRAAGPGQNQMTPRLRLETHGVGEGRSLFRQPRPYGRPALRLDEPDRRGGGVGGCERSDHEVT